MEASNDPGTTRTGFYRAGVHFFSDMRMDQSHSLLKGCKLNPLQKKAVTTMAGMGKRDVTEGQLFDGEPP